MVRRLPRCFGNAGTERRAERERVRILQRCGLTSVRGWLCLQRGLLRGLRPSLLAHLHNTAVKTLISPRPREQLLPVDQAQNKSQALKAGKGRRLQAAGVNLLLNLDGNFTTSVEGLDQKMAAISPDQTAR